MPTDKNDDNRRGTPPADDDGQRRPLTFDRNQWIARALAAAARHKRDEKPDRDS